MKIEITFTHWGFFYGLPVYFAIRNDGMFPMPIIPLTGWWISYVVPVIQSAREFMIVLLDIDTPERGHFTIERARKLKRPRVRAFDWDEDVVRDYLNG